MTTAQDLKAQQKQAEDHKLQADNHIAEQKKTLRAQLVDMDKQISGLQAQRSKTAADLSQLG